METLLKVKHVKDGICEAEVSLDTELAAKRLGTSLFIAARKDPLMLLALQYAQRLLILDKNVGDKLSAISEKIAADTLSKDQQS